MRLSFHIQVFLANFHRQRCQFISKITYSNYILTLLILEYDYRSLAVFTSGISQHLSTFLYKMTEVLIGIILCRVTHLAGLSIHLNQRILDPSPWRDTIILQDEIPVVILITSSSQVIRKEEEGMDSTFLRTSALSTCSLEKYLQVFFPFGLSTAIFHRSCLTGIDRLHVIACNVLRRIYGILNKTIVCGGSSLNLNVSDKARFTWLIRGFCDVGAVTLHLLPILSTILSIWIMWVLKTLGTDFLFISDRDDAFLRLVVLL